MRSFLFSITWVFAVIAGSAAFGADGPADASASSAACESANEAYQTYLSNVTQGAPGQSG